jgi:hypothetical protein
MTNLWLQRKKNLTEFLKTAVLFCGIFMFSFTTKALPFFKNGKTDWNIVISEHAKKTEVYAAEELATALKKISGANFPIVYKAIKQNNNIYVGTPASLKEIRNANLNLNKNNEQAMAVYIKNNNLYLAGMFPRGALYAVYLFLQKQMDVKWLWPGKNGEFISRKKEFELPEKLETNYAPDIKYRGCHGLNGGSKETDKWIGRNFGNILRYGIGRKDEIARRQKFGFFIYATGHNAILDNSVFEKHPEYFALLGGKRVTGQLCWNSKGAENAVFNKLKELVEKFPQIEILGMYPEDTRNYCQCEHCRKNDVSTEWFNFYNRICNRLVKLYPNLKFTTIAYQGYMNVPKNPPRQDGFVEYAMYDRCYVHDIGKCKVNDKSTANIEKWLNTGCKIGIYGYEFDIFKPSRMIPLYGTLADQVRYFKKNKIISVIPEIPIYGSPKNKPREERVADQMRLGWFLYLQLLFNPDLDWKELIHEWCRKVYPAASEPMAEYHILLADRWTKMKNHLSIYFLHPDPVVTEFLDAKTVNKVEKLFKQADALTAAIKKTESREFQQKEIAFEKKLWRQWLNAYNKRLENVVIIPNTTQIDDKSKYHFLEKTDLEVNGCWTSEHLNLRFYFGNNFSGNNLKVIVKSPYGISHTAEVVLKNNALTNISIPFSELGGKPLPYSAYVVSLNLKNIKKQFVVYLSSKNKIRKHLLFSLPCEKEPVKHYPTLRTELLKSDWQGDFVTNLKHLYTRELSQYDIIAVAMKDNSISSDFFRNKLLPFMKKGGMVILGGNTISPEKLFMSPSFKLKRIGPVAISSLNRKVTTLAPGKWKNSPCNLEEELKRYCTPFYGYEAPPKSQWKNLAAMRKQDRRCWGECSFILYMPVGKGKLVIASSSLGLSDYMLWVIGSCSHLNSTVYLFNNMYEFK